MAGAGAASSENDGPRCGHETFRKFLKKNRVGGERKTKKKKRRRMYPDRGTRNSSVFKKKKKYANDTHKHERTHTNARVRKKKMKNRRRRRQNHALTVTPRRRRRTGRARGRRDSDGPDDGVPTSDVVCACVCARVWRYGRRRRWRSPHPSRRHDHVLRRRLDVEAVSGGGGGVRLG